VGVFDYVEISDQQDYAQVKTWDRTMATYKIGEKVPQLLAVGVLSLKRFKEEPKNGPYSIKTQENYGWINIDSNNVFISVTELPFFNDHYDKWGGNIDVN